jgi:hypothetical protein
MQRKTWFFFLVSLLAAGAIPGFIFTQTLNLDYSTYLGGSSEDHGEGISVGTDGRAYVTGLTGSSNFPIENPYQTWQGSAIYDVFVTALSSSGSALYYSTYLGGSDSDGGYGISLGTDGVAYVTGFTMSTDFPTKNPYQAGSGGNVDVFVTALSSTGSALSYSTYLGGSDYDEGNGISLGPDGAAYVAGSTYSSDFPTENPYQAGYGGNADVFVTALSSTGSALSYSTYLKGSGWDVGYGISLGTDGSAYVTGDTTSSDFPTVNPYQAVHGGASYDVFVSALSSTGSALSYSTYLGGSDDDKGYGINLGTDGAAYVTGETSSTDFPTENPYQAVHGGFDDVFVSALSSTGSALSYSTYLGGSSYDRGRGISLGTDGAAYITGFTYSSDFPTENPYQAVHSGGVWDVFVSALSSTGSALSYSTYLWGSDSDEGHGISVGTDGAAYVTGDTKSSNFPIENPYQANHGGGTYDAFVSRLILVASPTPSVTPIPSATPTPSVTPTPTPSVTPIPSATPTPSVTPPPTPIPSATPIPSVTPTPSAIPTPTVTPGIAAPPWITDFNGDGTSDIAIFRGNSGLWAIRGITRVYFGSSNDETVPGDYNGDGTTEIGIFRGTSGLWAIRSTTRAYFGSGSDFPEPGDYDGDGTADIGIYRSASGLWAIQGVTRVYFGSSADTPVPGYYAGSTSKNIGIFRDSSGLWAIRGVTRSYFGSSSDIVVPGDYDGDGSWDIGIFRPSFGLWAIRGVTRSYFGSGSDQPVPADYKGDGMDDIGIFRGSSGLWAIRGVSRVYFGTSGDVPVTR